MSTDTYSITSTIKHYPSFPYQNIKEAILGKKYTLSLTFVGEKRAQQLNINYRKKDYVPNVLSFPLDENNGEIFICPKIANKEAWQYNLTKDGYIAFLFIHGLLHLKGYDHGVKMEQLEKRYMKRFDIV
ncbi:MAG: rRNA maturation RNase YbeY [Candidatus Nomurabacteria bacterium]|nr:rRNA maturation RNase YbeY [Candidatus Nomurabacteria bacterium]USN87655.1 MAG: rRNA maturation RNase YbeY [Candidatus Nomurabacteria bacterium]